MHLLLATCSTVLSAESPPPPSLVIYICVSCSPSPSPSLSFSLLLTLEPHPPRLVSLKTIVRRNPRVLPAHRCILRLPQHHAPLAGPSFRQKYDRSPYNIARRRLVFVYAGVGASRGWWAQLIPAATGVSWPSRSVAGVASVCCTTPQPCDRSTKPS